MNHLKKILLKKILQENGFVKVHELLSFNELEELRVIYDQLLKDKENTIHLRSDLAGQSDFKTHGIERITQIMLPSQVIKELSKHMAYKKALDHAQLLLGHDIELDFDMLINKAPYTNTETPWHQDAAYWIDLPDKRAVSCWIALDDANENNGCMWFLPSENKQILEHFPLPNGGALYCTPNTSNAIPVPLKAGGCTFHDGYTLHFSKGNTTENQRRALILNFRPKKMIDLERKHGMDHTGRRELRTK